MIGEGLHRPPSFLGVYGAVQGAGAIVGGIPLGFVMRRLGSARVVGFSLAAFSLASAAWMTSSLWLVLLAALFDGIGLVWLVAAATTAAQRYTPPSLQGRVNAALMMLIVTPQTLLDRGRGGPDLRRQLPADAGGRRRDDRRVRACPADPSGRRSGRGRGRARHRGASRRVLAGSADEPALTSSPTHPPDGGEVLASPGPAASVKPGPAQRPAHGFAPALVC